MAEKLEKNNPSCNKRRKKHKEREDSDKARTPNENPTDKTAKHDRNKLKLDESLSAIRLTKLQSRTSKLRVQNLMSTIVEESVPPLKFEEKQKPKTNSDSDPAATCHDVESISLNNITVRDLKNEKFKEYFNFFEEKSCKRRKEISRKSVESGKLRRSHSNDDIYKNDYMVYSVHVDSTKKNRRKQDLSSSSESRLNRLRKSEKLDEGEEEENQVSWVRVRRPSILSCIISDVLKERRLKKLKEAKNKDNGDSISNDDQVGEKDSTQETRKSKVRVKKVISSKAVREDLSKIPKQLARKISQHKNDNSNTMEGGDSMQLNSYEKIYKKSLHLRDEDEGKDPTKQGRIKRHQAVSEMDLSSLSNKNKEFSKRKKDKNRREYFSSNKRENSFVKLKQSIYQIAENNRKKLNKYIDLKKYTKEMNDRYIKAFIKSNDLIGSKASLDTTKKGRDTKSKDDAKVRITPKEETKLYKELKKINKDDRRSHSSGKKLKTITQTRNSRTDNKNFCNLEKVLNSMEATYDNLCSTQLSSKPKLSFTRKELGSLEIPAYKSIKELVQESIDAKIPSIVIDNNIKNCKNESKPITKKTSKEINTFQNYKTGTIDEKISPITQKQLKKSNTSYIHNARTIDAKISPIIIEDNVKNCKDTSTSITQELAKESNTFQYYKTGSIDAKISPIVIDENGKNCKNKSTPIIQKPSKESNSSQNYKTDIINAKISPITIDVNVKKCKNKSTPISQKQSEESNTFQLYKTAPLFTTTTSTWTSYPLRSINQYPSFINTDTTSKKQDEDFTLKSLDLSYENWLSPSRFSLLSETTINPAFNSKESLKYDAAFFNHKIFESFPSKQQIDYNRLSCDPFCYMNLHNFRADLTSQGINTDITWSKDETKAERRFKKIRYTSKIPTRKFSTRQNKTRLKAKPYENIGQKLSTETTVSIKQEESKIISDCSLSSGTNTNLLKSKIPRKIKSSKSHSEKETPSTIFEEDNSKILTDLEKIGTEKPHSILSRSTEWTSEKSKNNVPKVKSENDNFKSSLIGNLDFTKTFEANMPKINKNGTQQCTELQKYYSQNFTNLEQNFSEENYAVFCVSDGFDGKLPSTNERLNSNKSLSVLTIQESKINISCDNRVKTESCHSLSLQILIPKTTNEMDKNPGLTSKRSRFKSRLPQLIKKKPQVEVLEKKSILSFPIEVDLKKLKDVKVFEEPSQAPDHSNDSGQDLTPLVSFKKNHSKILNFLKESFTFQKKLTSSSFQSESKSFKVNNYINIFSFPEQKLGENENDRISEKEIFLKEENLSFSAQKLGENIDARTSVEEIFLKKENLDDPDSLNTPLEIPGDIKNHEETNPEEDNPSNNPIINEDSKNLSKLHLEDHKVDVVDIETLPSGNQEDLKVDDKHISENNLQESLSGEGILNKIEEVSVNTPMIKGNFGLSWYAFKSDLRYYQEEKDVLKMLGPCIRGQMMKAPKIPSEILIKPNPILQKVASQKCKLEVIDREIPTIRSAPVVDLEEYEESPVTDEDQKEDIEDKGDTAEKQMRELKRLQGKKLYLYEIISSEKKESKESVKAPLIALTEEEEQLDVCVCPEPCPCSSESSSCECESCTCDEEEDDTEVEPEEGSVARREDEQSYLSHETWYVESEESRIKDKKSLLEKIKTLLFKTRNLKRSSIISFAYEEETDEEDLYGDDLIEIYANDDEQSLLSNYIVARSKGFQDLYKERINEEHLCPFGVTNIHPSSTSLHLQMKYLEASCKNLSQKVFSSCKSENSFSYSPPLKMIKLEEQKDPDCNVASDKSLKFMHQKISGLSINNSKTIFVTTFSTHSSKHSLSLNSTSKEAESNDRTDLPKSGDKSRSSYQSSKISSENSTLPYVSDTNDQSTYSDISNISSDSETVRKDYCLEVVPSKAGKDLIIKYPDKTFKLLMSRKNRAHGDSFLRELYAKLNSTPKFLQKMYTAFDEESPKFDIYMQFILESALKYSHGVVKLDAGKVFEVLKIFEANSRRIKDEDVVVLHLETTPYNTVFSVNNVNFIENPLMDVKVNTKIEEVDVSRNKILSSPSILQKFEEDKVVDAGKKENISKTRARKALQIEEDTLIECKRPKLKARKRKRKSELKIDFNDDERKHYKEPIDNLHNILDDSTISKIKEDTVKINKENDVIHKDTAICKIKEDDAVKINNENDVIPDNSVICKIKKEDSGRKQNEEGVNLNDMIYKIKEEDAVIKYDDGVIPDNSVICKIKKEGVVKKRNEGNQEKEDDVSLREHDKKAKLHDVEHKKRKETRNKICFRVKETKIEFYQDDEGESLENKSKKKPGKNCSDDSKEFERQYQNYNCKVHSSPYQEVYIKHPPLLWELAKSIFEKKDKAKADEGERKERTRGKFKSTSEDRFGLKGKSSVASYEANFKTPRSASLFDNYQFKISDEGFKEEDEESSSKHDKVKPKKCNKCKKKIQRDKGEAEKQNPENVEEENNEKTKDNSIMKNRPVLKIFSNTDKPKNSEENNIVKSKPKSLDATTETEKSNQIILREKGRLALQKSLDNILKAALLMDSKEEVYPNISFGTNTDNQEDPSDNFKDAGVQYTNNKLLKCVPKFLKKNSSRKNKEKSGTSIGVQGSFDVMFFGQNNAGGSQNNDRSKSSFIHKMIKSVIGTKKRDKQSEKDLNKGFAEQRGEAKKLDCATECQNECDVLQNCQGKDKGPPDKAKTKTRNLKGFRYTTSKITKEETAEDGSKFRNVRINTVQSMKNDKMYKLMIKTTNIAIQTDIPINNSQSKATLVKEITSKNSIIIRKGPGNKNNYPEIIEAKRGRPRYNNDGYSPHNQPARERLESKRVPKKRNLETTPPIVIDVTKDTSSDKTEKPNIMEIYRKNKQDHCKICSKNLIPGRLPLLMSIKMNDGYQQELEKKIQTSQARKDNSSPNTTELLKSEQTTANTDPSENHTVADSLDQISVQEKFNPKSNRSERLVLKTSSPFIIQGFTINPLEKGPKTKTSKDSTMKLRNDRLPNQTRKIKIYNPENSTFPQSFTKAELIQSRNTKSNRFEDIGAFISANTLYSSKTSNSSKSFPRYTSSPRQNIDSFPEDTNSESKQSYDESTSNNFMRVTSKSSKVASFITFDSDQDNEKEISPARKSNKANVKLAKNQDDLIANQRRKIKQIFEESDFIANLALNKAKIISSSTLNDKSSTSHNERIDNCSTNEDLLKNVISILKISKEKLLTEATSMESSNSLRKSVLLDEIISILENDMMGPGRKRQGNTKSKKELNKRATPSMRVSQNNNAISEHHRRKALLYYSKAEDVDKPTSSKEILDEIFSILEGIDRNSPNQSSSSSNVKELLLDEIIDVLENLQSSSQKLSCCSSEVYKENGQLSTIQERSEEKSGLYSDQIKKDIRDILELYVNVNDTIIVNRSGKRSQSVLPKDSRVDEKVTGSKSRNFRKKVTSKMRQFFNKVTRNPTRSSDKIEEEDVEQGVSKISELMSISSTDQVGRCSGQVGRTSQVTINSEVPSIKSFETLHDTYKDYWSSEKRRKFNHSLSGKDCNDLKDVNGSGREGLQSVANEQDFGGKVEDVEVLKNIFDYSRSSHICKEENFQLEVAREKKNLMSPKRVIRSNNENYSFVRELKDFRDQVEGGPDDSLKLFRKKLREERLLEKVNFSDTDKEPTKECSTKFSGKNRLEVDDDLCGFFFRDRWAKANIR